MKQLLQWGQINVIMLLHNRNTSFLFFPPPVQCKEGATLKDFMANITSLNTKKLIHGSFYCFLVFVCLLLIWMQVILMSCMFRNHTEPYLIKHEHNKDQFDLGNIALGNTETQNRPHLSEQQVNCCNASCVCVRLCIT